VRPRDRELARKLDQALRSFRLRQRPLAGIQNLERRRVLVEQLLESIRRVRYVSVVSTRQLSERRADPNDELFDPLMAAVLHQRRGNVEEAFWLVFLFVHFGRHVRAGWRYAREVYGRLGTGLRWDWANTSADPAGFREWLDAHQEEFKREGVPRGFGNHRKYQSLDAHSATGTGAAVETYVRWVNPPRSHQELVAEALDRCGGDRRLSFDALFRSMNAVASFGRTARFDYLTMVGKLGLAPIEPGSTYMQGSTGPVEGARLLFGGRTTAALSPADLDRWLVELDARIQVGMQVLEDALCNWQKSPGRFKPFRL
jgi:alpha-glutamyl/putrescinyl thymine pyrophosphorylase-like protein